jgi:hypothetical protein
MNIKGMKCCLMNARSVVNKTELIKDIIVENNIDIAIITETWLSASHGNFHSVLTDLCPPNHKILSKARNKRGGGLAVIYRNTLDITIMDIKSTNVTSYEHLTLSIRDISSNSRSTQLLVAIYRPPSKPLNAFISELQQHLDEVRLKPGVLTVVGDLNIHLEKVTPTTTRLIDVLDSYKVKINHTPATHMKGHVLDAVATEYPVQVKLLDPGLSDHSVLIYHLQRTIAIPKSAMSVSYRQTRNFSDINLDDFKIELEQSLACATQFQYVDARYDFIMSTFLKHLDKHAPLVQRRCKVRSFKYNAEVAAAKQKRRQLERKYKNSKLSIDRQLLVSQNKVVKRLAAKNKEKFYSSLISESSNKTKTVFNIFSTLSTDARVLLPTGLKNTAESMAVFFSDKVAQIVEHFPEVDPLRFADSFDDFQLKSFDEVTPMDVNNINIKCSSNDPAPTRFIRKILPALLTPITDLINLSFHTAEFPSALKQATVIPIIKDKKGNSNDLKNYRPVSLLGFISKIMERIVANQLNRYITCNSLGNHRQSAYKSFHSVETSLLALQSELLEVLDKGRSAFLILLDLSAAFDTVDHELLLRALNTHYHITGNALSWFRSYLHSRSYTVRINDAHSTVHSLPTGVPQGSVLGPILFNTFSSGLAGIFEEFQVSAYCYADDVQFYVSFKDDEEDARSLVDQLFKRLSDWMNNNHLKLNADKTLFTNH